jgi:tRNA(Ile)-lysidine synthase
VNFDFDAISSMFNKKIESFLDTLCYRPAALGIAVSGGSDSLGLLYLINSWPNPTNLKILVLTVDHDLRHGSAKDATYVSELCKKTLFSPYNSAMGS